MTSSITIAVKIEMTVSAGFKIIMVMNVAVIEIVELIIWGMLWLINWRRVSISLV